MKIFKNTQLILQLDNEGIYINPDKKLSYSKTNLPKRFFTFQTRTEIYWNVDIIDSGSSAGHIKVAVLDYQEDQHYGIAFQEPPFQINYIEFDTLDWAQLQLQLTNYYPNKLEPFINKESNQLSLPERSFASPQQPVYLPFKDTVKIKFEDAIFKDAKVVFDTLVGTRMQTFEITNTFIKSVFDPIKKWFIKKFNKRTFTAVISGKLYRGELIEPFATSEEISLIDESFIETFQTYFVEDLFKKDKSNKESFVIPITKLVEDGTLGNALYSPNIDDVDLLKQVLTKHKFRNEQELDYLASHPHVQRNKVQLTLPPQPGFILSFEVNTVIHFVWELFNSHATYVWSFSATPLDEIIRILNDDISYIDLYKRNKFKKSYKERKPGYLFDTINHPADEKYGFTLWSQNLESILHTTK